MAESSVPQVELMEDEQEDVVTPWEATCGKEGFDYEKLTAKFGCSVITDELIDRIERVTGHRAHHWLRRHLFFAHREMEKILDAYEKGEPIFLYTGRGPTSDALHLGHMVPFIFTKWLQDVFGAYLVIQIADDEKSAVKGIPIERIYGLGFENAKDIIACGFDPKKTFIFSHHDFRRTEAMSNLVCKMQQLVRFKDLKSVFGVEDDCNIGQIDWPIHQSAAAFSQAYGPVFGLGNQSVLCLVAYAIDQDPYFRLCRDIAPKLKFLKPCAIMSEFLPALQGSAKMSSSVPTEGLVPTIFMTDPPKNITNKINKYAYSGGKDTVEEHREKGANLKVDISFQYLKYFEEDDAVLAQIADEYGSGRMLSGEIKAILAKKIVEITSRHQERRAAITPADIALFYCHDKSSEEELAMFTAKISEILAK